MPAGSAGEEQASHVVVQHREQPICGALGGRLAVSFVWVYASVRAGRLLDVAEDKARPPSPGTPSHCVPVYALVQTGRLRQCRKHACRAP